MVEVASMDQLEQLKAEESLLMVKAYGNNCKKCKAVAPKFDKFAAQHSGDFTCAAINLSTVKGAFNALGVREVPLFIAFRDGERVEDRVASDLTMMEDLAAAGLMQDLPDCDEEEECVLPL